jgi:Transglycosylase SLT domain
LRTIKSKWRLSVATQVPASFQPYVSEASSGTGIPADVVAAQANEESGFNAKAVSGAGAEGWLQFEPSTYDAYAPNVGVAAGTEFNVADETKVYISYMNALLSQEGGSVFKALEAYNAGPGNLAAGSGYASTILKNAGEPQSLTASPNASTTVNWDNPLGGIIGGIENAIGGGASSLVGGAANDIASGIVNSILGAFGIKDLSDLFQRLGLMLLGVGLVFLGIHLLGQGKGSPVNVTLNTTENQNTGKVTRTRTVNAPHVKSTRKTVTGGTAGKGVVKTGAADAMEAAAIA